MNDEKERLALLQGQINETIKEANRAVAAETAHKYGRAVYHYGRVVKLLYHAMCFSAGISLRKTSLKSSPTAKPVNFNNSQIVEALTNKIVDVFSRMRALHNALSTGDAETFALMRSVDIPLDIADAVAINDNVEDAANVDDVLIRIDLNPETDTFENIIGHEFTKEKLKQLSHSFSLNANENAKNILKSRNVSSNRMIILYGEPGTGKTSLVRALAYHINVPLYELKLSALYNKYVGESEKKMSSIFDWILSSPRPKIVFIDELDSLFSKRGSGNEESLDKKLKIIFMTEMNRFSIDARSNTLIVGATNLIDDIDDAVTRRSVLNIKVNKPSTLEEYRRLVHHQFAKLKLNAELGVTDAIARAAYDKLLTQSKISDIVQKIFSFVTARITKEFFVRPLRDAHSYFSLTGNVLGPSDVKYEITDRIEEEEEEEEAEKATLDSDLVDNVVLPLVTVRLLRENEVALL